MRRSFRSSQGCSYNNLGCAALAAVCEILVNNSALRRLIETRREKTQFYAGFCDIARSNRNLQLILLPFQASQDAFIA